MIRRRAALAAALLAVSASAAGAAGAGPADLSAARHGAGWLAAAAPSGPGGAQADAVVAMAAAGRGRRALAAPLARLSRIAPAYARTSGAAAKVALAAVAAGADPRRLGRVDYLARVRRGYAAGRYGASAVDQALSMLALAAARAPVPPAAISAVRATRGARRVGLHPRRRGDRTTSPPRASSSRPCGPPASRPPTPGCGGAAAWMMAQRNPEGGLSLDGGGRPTEADATAIAIMALRSLGRTPPPAMRAALRALQRPDGAFAFTATSTGSPLLATNDAVPALAGRWLPPPFPPAGEAH